MKIKRGFILAAAVSVLVLGCMALTSCGSDTAGKGGNITVISREDGSGTRGAFIELFGIEEITNGEKMDMTVDTADITNSTSVMMTSVSGNVRAIGYISLGSLNDSVKALNVDGAEATAETYSDLNPNAEIEIQQSDSTTGVTNALSGVCDIGMASRELKDSEKEKGASATVIALDGIAVIVNNENPLNNITSEQVKQIYTGETTGWDDIH